MNPKLYYDNFLIGNRENKLYCFLPFLDTCKNRFDDTLKPTAEFMKLTCEKAEDETSSKEIMERIYEGINRSRLLLFDFSRDNRYGDKINPNVAYELGVARSIRHDTDILLITDIEEIDNEIPFDIKGMNIIKIKDLTREKFYEILKSTLEKQQYYQDKRMETVIKSMDGESLILMYKYGRLPDGYNHFGSLDMPSELKMSALRMLDFGILTTAIACYKDAYEYAYYWTPFGKAIMKLLDIKEIDLETFKTLAIYEQSLKNFEAWKEFRKNVS